MVRVVAVVALVAVTWGLNAPVSKLLYRADGGALFDGYTLTVARAVWSLPLVALLLWRTWPKGARIPRADAAPFALLSVAFAASAAVLAIALARTSAAHGVLCLGLTPAATAALEALRTRERPTLTALGAIAAGIAATAGLAANRSAAHGTFGGDLLLGAWVLIFAVYSVTARRLTAAYAPPFVVALSSTAGFALLAAGGVLLGLGGATLHALASPPAALQFFGELIVGLNFVGPLGYAYAIRWSSALVAAAATLYGSVLAGLLAARLILGEGLSLSAQIAAVLILLSLGLTFARPARRLAEAPS